MNAPELFDAADAAAAGRPAAWWAKQPPVLWLTSEIVQVGDRKWRARHHADRDGAPVHGYTPRQCTQIRDALLPVLAAFETRLAAHARNIC
jgi:hypothetical protein